MPFDPRALAALGRLAKLPVNDTLGAELERVVELFDALAQAPVDGLAPLAHPHDAAVTLRADAVTAGDRSDRLLALAPESAGGYFLVPKVIE